MNYLAASDKEIKDELAKGLSEKSLNQLSKDVIYCVRMICVEIQSENRRNCAIQFFFPLYGRVLKNKLPLIKRCVNFLMNDFFEIRFKTPYIIYDLGSGLIKIKVRKKERKKDGDEIKIIKKRSRPRKCKNCGYLDPAGGDICPSCEESR